MTGVFGSKIARGVAGLWFGVAVLGAVPCRAQEKASELPRRVFLGAQLIPVKKAAAAAAGLPDTLGVTVVAVGPNTPATRLGLLAGDVVRAVNGQSVTGVPDLMNRVRTAHDGDKWTLSVRRNTQDLTLKGRLESRPKETSPAYTVQYEAVRLPDGVRRRTIVAVPPGAGRKPAILFMGGVGCYSLDNPAGVVGAYGQLLAGLTQAGFITCRVEKSGIGDSEGAPCPSVDFNTEVAGYRAALTALRARPDVDPARVYLLGHSIGGVIAPVLAAESPVRGAIAIETAGLPWYEYLLANSRRQMPLAGVAPADIDQTMRAVAQANYAFYVEHQSLEQVEAQHTDAAKLIALPMSAAYMQQVGDLNPLTLWLKAARPALFVAGGTDLVSSPDEHRALAEALNSVKPGLGEFVLVPELDHTLGRAATPAEAYTRMTTPGPPTPFNTGVLDAVLKWLRAQQG